MVWTLLVVVFLLGADGEVSREAMVGVSSFSEASACKAAGVEAVSALAGRDGVVGAGFVCMAEPSV